MFCKNCGKDIAEQASFCSACGTKIIDSHENRNEITATTGNPKKKSKSTFKKILIGVGICFLAIIGILIVSEVLGNIKNTRPAEYVKDIVSYKEGSNAIVVYFTLADANGTQTANVGDCKIDITYNKKHYIGYESYTDDVPVYSTTTSVKVSDFNNATVGMGAFEHKALILSLGRIEYSQFSESVQSGDKGEIKITFKSNGKEIESKETIFF